MSTDIVVREARLEDLPRLIPMARRFVEESNLPFTFDIDASTTHFTYAIENEEFIFLVEEDEGVLTGGIMGVLDRDFCKEVCAYVTKMYIESEFRGLGTSRALLEAFQGEVKKRGASIIFASATAGMGDKVERLYVKLFQRYGYEVLGRVLAKEI